MNKLGYFQGYMSKVAQEPGQYGPTPGQTPAFAAQQPRPQMPQMPQTPQFNPQHQMQQQMSQFQPQTAQNLQAWRTDQPQSRGWAQPYTPPPGMGGNTPMSQMPQQPRPTPGSGNWMGTGIMQRPQPATPQPPSWGSQLFSLPQQGANTLVGTQVRGMQALRDMAQKGFRGIKNSVMGTNEGPSSNEVARDMGASAPISDQNVNDYRQSRIQELMQSMGDGPITDEQLAQYKSITGRGNQPQQAPAPPPPPRDIPDIPAAPPEPEAPAPPQQEMPPGFRMQQKQYEPEDIEVSPGEMQFSGGQTAPELPQRPTALPERAQKMLDTRLKQQKGRTTFSKEPEVKGLNIR